MGAYVVVVASGVVAVAVVSGGGVELVVVGFIVTGFWSGLCDRVGNNGLYSATASALELGNKTVYNDGL